MNTEKTQVATMTTEELEQMLAQRKEEERRTRLDAKKEYEKERDTFVKLAYMKGIEFNTAMLQFKNELAESFDRHSELLNEYGGIRTNSKGGFSLTNSEGTIRVRRIRATQPQWDERSKKGEELITIFLKDKIRNKKLYHLVMSFLQRNEQGDLEYSRVMSLLQMRDQWNDERWLQGLDLMQESYSVHLRAFGYELQRKNDAGKWERLELNFSSI